MEHEQVFKIEHVVAKVFDDALLGIKAKTSLPPGEYDAVVVLSPRSKPTLPQFPDGPETLDDYVNRMRKEYVLRALDAAGGNRTQAAKLLGVDIRTVFRVLEKAESES